MRTSHENSALLVDIGSEAEMETLGHLLAHLIQPGDVIRLDGPLGAGKTRLVRSMATALGCERAWAGSPTFMLVQEYDGTPPIYHMDAYRLKDSQEFRELGGEDYLWGDGVCLIEWAERIADVLPEDSLRLSITVTSPTSRQLRISAAQGRSAELLNELTQRLQSN